MQLEGAVCLVTGANRGLGAVFVKSLLAAGAAKVYAGARKPESVTNPDAHPVALDITNQDQVAAAAAACNDVSILINNAGVMLMDNHLNPNGAVHAEQEMRTNYFGTMAMCRAFAPILRQNGGGALVNILSVASWYASPFNGTYASSKAAAWLQSRPRCHMTWTCSTTRCNELAGRRQLHDALPIGRGHRRPAHRWMRSARIFFMTEISSLAAGSGATRRKIASVRSVAQPQAVNCPDVPMPAEPSPVTQS